MSRALLFLERKAHVMLCLTCGFESETDDETQADASHKTFDAAHFPSWVRSEPDGSFTPLSAEAAEALELIEDTAGGPVTRVKRAEQP